MTRTGDTGSEAHGSTVEKLIDGGGRMSDSGTAGASARREYERRRANDEARLRARWGPFGGMAVALSDERQSTTAWRTGAAGEERVGILLNAQRSDHFVVMHDRRLPGSRANIDHLVVTKAGVWVIDTKRYKGRPELQVEGGFIRPRTERLVINGRDKTPLVDGVVKQVERVAMVDPELPIVGVLCFVDAEWPLFGKPFSVDGIRVTGPNKLVHSLVNTTGKLHVSRTASLLDARFRPSI